MPPQAIYGGEYQGGAFVEVLGTQGTNPLNQWRVAGPAKHLQRQYDKTVKGSVYSSSGSALKLVTPKDDKAQLGLTQPYLVFQLSVLAPPLTIELSIQDASGGKRRMIFSSSFAEAKITPLHCQVPLAVVARSTWLNLTLPLGELVALFFRGAAFRSLDSICVSGPYRLRRVFTLRDAPYELGGWGGEDSHQPLPLPRGLELPPEVETFTQVLDARSLVSMGVQLPGTASSPGKPRVAPNSRGAIDTPGLRQSTLQDALEPPRRPAHYTALGALHTTVQLPCQSGSLLSQSDWEDEPCQSPAALLTPHTVAGRRQGPGQASWATPVTPARVKSPPPGPAGPATAAPWSPHAMEGGRRGVGVGNATSYAAVAAGFAGSGPGRPTTDSAAVSSGGRGNSVVAAGRRAISAQIGLRSSSTLTTAATTCERATCDGVAGHVPTLAGRRAGSPGPPDDTGGTLPPLRPTVTPDTGPERGALSQCSPLPMSPNTRYGRRAGGQAAGATAGVNIPSTIDEGRVMQATPRAPQGAVPVADGGDGVGAMHWARPQLNSRQQDVRGSVVRPGAGTSRTHSPGRGLCSPGGGGVGGGGSSRAAPFSPGAQGNPRSSVAALVSASGTRTESPGRRARERSQSPGRREGGAGGGLPSRPSVGTSAAAVDLAGLLQVRGGMDASADWSPLPPRLSSTALQDEDPHSVSLISSPKAWSPAVGTRRQTHQASADPPNPTAAPHATDSRPRKMSGRPVTGKEAPSHTTFTTSRVPATPGQTTTAPMSTSSVTHGAGPASPGALGARSGQTAGAGRHTPEPVLSPWGDSDSVQPTRTLPSSPGGNRPRYARSSSSSSITTTVTSAATHASPPQPASQLAARPGQPRPGIAGKPCSPAQRMKPASPIMASGGVRRGEGRGSPGRRAPSPTSKQVAATQPQQPQLQPQRAGSPGPGSAGRSQRQPSSSTATTVAATPAPGSQRRAGSPGRAEAGAQDARTGSPGRSRPAAKVTPAPARQAAVLPRVAGAAMAPSAARSIVGASVASSVCEVLDESVHLAAGWGGFGVDEESVLTSHDVKLPKPSPRTLHTHKLNCHPPSQRHPLHAAQGTSSQQSASTGPQTVPQPQEVQQQAGMGVGVAEGGGVSGAVSKVAPVGVVGDLKVEGLGGPVWSAEAPYATPKRGMAGPGLGTGLGGPGRGTLDEDLLQPDLFQSEALGTAVLAQRAQGAAQTAGPAGAAAQGPGAPATSGFALGGPLRRYTVDEGSLLGSSGGQRWLTRNQGQETDWQHIEQLMPAAADVAAAARAYTPPVALPFHTRDSHASSTSATTATTTTSAGPQVLQVDHHTSTSNARQGHRGTRQAAVGMPGGVRQGGASVRAGAAASSGVPKPATGRGLGLPGQLMAGGSGSASQSVSTGKVQARSQVADVAAGVPGAAASKGGLPSVRGEEVLDLVYDPLLNCYYDQQTGNYWQLATGG